MIKFKYISRFVLLAVVLIGGGFAAKHVVAQSETEPAAAIKIPPRAAVAFEAESVSVLKQGGEELYFTAELALTSPQHTQGLMFRTEMAEDAGMLFMFNSESKLSFWMKNTLIPLDMLFLSNDGIIHHIHSNAKPQDLTGITSKFPSKAVLELNGGTADKMGIKEGDQVLHRFFNNVGVQR